MADPTTTSTAITKATDRDERAWQMRIAGHGLQAIADALAYTSTREVSAVIRRRIDEGRKSIATMADQGAQLELERLEAQTRAVWPRVMQWERTNPRTGAPVVARDGNPEIYPFDAKAHQLALAIHDRRVRLLGLDKIKIELSGPNGGPIETAPADLGRLSSAELALLEHLHAKARGAAADTGGDVVDVEPDPA